MVWNPDYYNPDENVIIPTSTMVDNLRSPVMVWLIGIGHVRPILDSLSSGVQPSMGLNYAEIRYNSQ